MKEYRKHTQSQGLFSYDSLGILEERFKNPKGSDRPRIRWWVPSSLLSKKGIEYDIRSMAEAGFSGAEVVSMPRFDIPGSREVDWGSERWNEMSGHMLAMAEKYDFTIDFTMSPLWPLALPGITDCWDPDQGAQMEVDGARIEGITAENPYRGPVPVSKTAVEDAARVGAVPRLLAVTCARYLDRKTNTLEFASACKLEIGSQVVLEKDVWMVEFAPKEEGGYVLFAWWEHPSGERTCQNIQLDHYGRKASETLIRYWEKNIIPAYGPRFKNTVSMFIDSLEYVTHLDWTQGLLEQFERENGYDLTPFLPALYDSHTKYGNFADFPRPDFHFEKNSTQILNDYYEFLTRLYIENHLIPLTDFCEKHGLNMRYQTAYGKELELAQTAMYVSIPETETLYGGDILDFYRVQSGSMHIGGKRIYSIEASAEMNGRGNGKRNSGNYQQTWKNQLWHLGRAMACCVNQAVFHGYSYEGFYEGEGNEKGFMPGVHWPGHTTMGYSEFSNNWSSCQPNWLHVKRYTDFLARNQVILRAGTGRIDLAIYHHSYEETIDFCGAEKIYQDGGLLEQSGYTYDFVSPSQLALEWMEVKDGRLFEDGPAYRALIFDRQRTLPYETAKRLLAYAQAGLPIIFVGEYPKEPAFMGERGIEEAILRLKEFLNVRTVPDTSMVKECLEELGVYPRARYEGRTAVLNTCIHTEDGEYFYFYNYGDADDFYQAEEMGMAAFEVTLEGEGEPWFFDAWSGSISPVLSYTKTEKGVKVPIKLWGCDSCIIALRKGEEKPHADSSLRDIFCSETGRILEKISREEEAVRLSGWKLSLEVWSEGEIPSESKKTVHVWEKLDHLIPWKELPGMEGAAGVGVYRITFSFDQGAAGYYLKLGKVKDSISVKVNGRELCIDPLSKTIDLGELAPGENVLEITVASPLLNALLEYGKRHPYYDSQGKADEREPDAYGLLEDVYLVPYRVKDL